METREFIKALNMVKKYKKGQFEEPEIGNDLGVKYNEHKFTSKNREYTLKDFDDMVYSTFDKFVYNDKNPNKSIRTLFVNGDKKYNVDVVDTRDDYLLMKHMEMDMGVCGGYVNYLFKSVSDNKSQERYICAYDFISDLKTTLLPNYDIYLVRDFDNVLSYNIDDEGQLYKEFETPYYSFILIKKEFGSKNNSIFFLKFFISNLTFVEKDKEYNILCTDGFSFVEFDNHNRKLAFEVLEKINKDYNFYVNTFDEVASFEMVMRRGDNYFTRDIKLKDFKPVFNLSTHYNGGESFLEWHEKYVYTSKKKKEGISIFHGPAGTGKTSYIKRLSYELKTTHKFFLMPAQMIVQLHEPGVLQNFIMENIVPMIEDGWKVVLVLEDAEEMLKSREEFNNPYISTILNLSDGIMGEIYNFQIICTMNSKIEDIDSALLRPNRLIACKKFDYLNEQEAINLYKDISGKEIKKIDCNLIIDEANVENESYKKDVKRMKDGKFTVGEIYKLVESSDPNMLNGYIDGNTQQQTSSIGFNRG